MKVLLWTNTLAYSSVAFSMCLSVYHSILPSYPQMLDYAEIILGENALAYSYRRKKVL